MKKLIIHMGYNKSGSTTIQKWIYENERQLKSDNCILYPKAGRFEFTHHNFGWASIDERGLNFDKIVCELDEEISESNCEIFVISTEALSLKPYLSAMKIGDAFKRNGMDKKYEVTIFGIIRQQVNWLQSEYNQRIESTHLSKNFHEFTRSNWANLNYHDVFSRYRQELPDAHIRVAWFEDIVKRGGAGLVSSLFEAIPGEYYIDFERLPIPRKENPSLTMYVSELKRRLNEISEFELGKKVCAEFQARVEKGSSPRWASAEDELSILSKFEEQNIRVTEDFGSARTQDIIPWGASGRSADLVPDINDPVAEANFYLDKSS